MTQEQAPSFSLKPRVCKRCGRELWPFSQEEDAEGGNWCVATKVVPVLRGGVPSGDYVRVRDGHICPECSRKGGTGHGDSGE